MDLDFIDDDTYTISVASATDNAGNAYAGSDTFDMVFDTGAPSITISSFDTDNGATDYAVDGSTITIAFTTSEQVSADPTCAIQSNNVDLAADETVTDVSSGAGTSWTCTVVVDANDNDGVVSFDISVSDLAGNAANADETNTASTVTLDLTDPGYNTVTIADNGAGDANDADIITLSFTSGETLSSASCTFTSGGDAMANSGSISASNTGNDDWECTIAVDNGDTDGTVGFLITGIDSAGNSGTANAITGGNNIDVDNTHPSVTVDVHVPLDGSTGTIDDTPTYTLSSGEAGAITYSGASCNVGGDDTGSILANIATAVTFDQLAEDTYACTVTVTDAAGNAGTATLNTFIVDTNSSCNNRRHRR